MHKPMLLALAPMKDVTDLAFIKTLNDLNSLPDYFITEYFRTVAHHKKMAPYIMRSIDENPTGRPIYGQLVGQEPEHLVRDALNLMNHACAGVDLNMGCPAPIVCRRGAGGGMLRSLRAMDSPLGALRDSLPAGGFSVKCRLGYETPDEFERILPVIARHTPDRVCIHARTVREGYRSPVHPEWVKWAAETLKCPVIANGNIVDMQTAEAWVRLAAPAGLMAGRAALRNPWIFSQLRAHFRGEAATAPTFRDLLRYIRSLYKRTLEMQDHYVEEKHIHRMKKYLVYTARGLPEEFDHHMKRAKTSRDFMHICEEILDNDTPFPPTPPEDTHLFAHFNALLTQEKACLPAGIQL